MCRILYICRPKTGTIVVSKIITGAPEDMTVFRVTLTGQSAEPTIVGPFDLSQEAPAICRNLPFDTYVVTEEVQAGHTQTSTHDPIVLTRANRNQSITVVNELGNALKLLWNNITNAPASDVSGWNIFFFGIGFTEFTKSTITGNVSSLFGASSIALSNYLFQNNLYLVEVDDALGCIINSGYGAFKGCIATSYKLDTMENCAFETFANVGSCDISMKSLYAFGTDCFLGTIGKTISLHIPASHMTSNGGNPQADLQYLIDNNTVTVFDPIGTQLYPI